MDKDLKYSIIIEWSDEDQAFIVSLPEWGRGAHTHGETYEEAFKNALEVLDMLVYQAKEDHQELPQPHQFNYEERAKPYEKAAV